MNKTNFSSHGRPILFILLIVFIVYAPSLRNGFVNWDDDVHLLSNPFVQRLDLKSIRDIFTTTVNHSYIPLTSLSFAIEHRFFGQHPFMYHLDSLFLHMATTVLVLLFALECGFSLRAALAGALIFGVHPIHVESVVWVTERKDVLYAFFYMLALTFYVKYIGVLREGAGGRKQRYFILTIITGILSILSKPMALSLPFVLFLCDWFLRRKVSRTMVFEKILLCIFIVPVAWVSYQMHKLDVHLDMPHSILIWIWCFVFYIRKFFYPDFSVLIYKAPDDVSLANPSYLFPAVVFVALMGAVILLRKNRVFLFALSFYFASIFFLLRSENGWTINIVADRYTYLPSLGWCLMLSAGYEFLFEKYKANTCGKFVIAGLIIIGVGVLSLKTAWQTRVWRNGVSLWEHQLRRQPQVATALIYEKLAQAHVLEGDFHNDPRKIQQITDYYNSAIHIKPDYAAAYYGLGDLYVRLGRPGPALDYFLKTITFDPGHFEAYYQAGRLYSERGEYQRAVDAFKKAVEINPDNERMYDKIMRFYAGQITGGRGGEAYRQANQELNEKYSVSFGRKK